MKRGLREMLPLASSRALATLAARYDSKELFWQLYKNEMRHQAPNGFQVGRFPVSVLGPQGATATFTWEPKVTPAVQRHISIFPRENYYGFHITEEPRKTRYHFNTYGRPTKKRRVPFDIQRNAIKFAEWKKQFELHNYTR